MVRAAPTTPSQHLDSRDYILLFGAALPQARWPLDIVLLFPSVRIQTLKEDLHVADRIRKRIETSMFRSPFLLARRAGASKGLGALSDPLGHSNVADNATRNHRLAVLCQRPQVSTTK